MCTNNCNECNDCQPTVCGCPNGTISCKCVLYEGDTLANTGIVAGDSACTSNKKIDDAIGKLIQAKEESELAKEESELPPYETATVESSDTSLEVTSTFDGGNLQTTYDVKIGFGDTTYEEDVTLTTPVTATIEKTPATEGNYFLQVKYVPTTSQQLAPLRLLGKAVTSGTPTANFTVTYQGVSGSNIVIPNQVVKVGSNVTLNSNFRIALNTDTLLAGYVTEFTIPSYSVSGTTSYIPLASIDLPPLRRQSFNCKLILHTTPIGGGQLLVTDPNIGVSNLTSGAVDYAVDYDRAHFDGIIDIVPLAGAYAEIRLILMENFPITITLDQSISILSSSAISYNIL